MSQQKYYVVWKGKNPGFESTWEAFKPPVDDYPGSLYRSYRTKNEAKTASNEGCTPKRETITRNTKPATNYIRDSISVDAACSGNPGDMEYRGVDTETGEELFHVGPIAQGTNNIGEFLAIVHALALLKQTESTTPIYTDSMTAMSWVRNKQANTTLVRNEETERIWQLIERATTWLQNNTYTNKILKWDTKNWGEIKADFGRK